MVVAHVKQGDKMRKKQKKPSDPKKPDVNEGVKTAIHAIESVMKRKHLSLCEIYRAVGIMADCAVEKTIMEMRADGCSIRKIARRVHMDDSRVSAIIKRNPCKCHCHK